jgi:hypothetical protein
VLLAAGTFQSTAALAIKADGVVLRGSGSREKGTTIQMTALPTPIAIERKVIAAVA